MRNLLLIGLMALSLSANAEQKDKELEYCAGKAALMSMIASVKGNGLSIDDARQIAVSNFGPGTKWNYPEKGIESAVMIVFDSPQLSMMGADGIREVVFQQCYQPANR